MNGLKMFMEIIILDVVCLFRCCMSIMAFRYELLGSTMELYITKNGKNEDEIDVYKYTIDLINRSYEVELYESF